MVLAAIACRHGGGVAPGRECHDGWCMPKRKTPKAWTAYTARGAEPGLCA
jgi:hypothetical protein